MMKNNLGYTVLDGGSLRRRLQKSLLRSRIRAFGLVLPLLAFLIVGFIVPISTLLVNSVYDARFSNYMTNLTPLLGSWNGLDEPSEEMYSALVADLVINAKNKTIGKVAIRVNRELSGTRSLFTSTARKAKNMKEPFKEAVIERKKGGKTLGFGKL